ncbi:MAG: pantetheine-phosphate adenylyltransferase [Gammaproteobacteria bacterium]|nr:pantetheine-phosphate adenylyltransferase [Gammaproteobacteria bacterium]MXY56850.1 pantetheine-phosphate adenylyltransferase [Gammaproteobacteria bacterium]MYF27490.1 pantetheine-phosphate adenylyltransferase [Gammaproteobacteria bacterium]MYK46451.1 pantetheine-phosphate adenylyltransferase [Gammaproteobacteria bacterium]
MTSVVYPGSFNPITNGHRDIVERALRLFDKVIVAVGTSPDKDPETHLAERIGLCRMALAEFGDRVEVEGFNTLLVDYAHSKNTRFVVRGLRTISDFDYEYQMIAMNQTLDPDLEYVLLPTSRQWSFLSSSRVREIAGLGGDISEFVHPAVAAHYQSTNG